MNGIRSGTSRDIENLLNVEIRFGGSRRADGISLVRFANMQRSAIDVGIHGYSANAHLVTGADHAYRNLSTIRDEDFLEHQSLRRTRRDQRQSEQILYWTIARTLAGLGTKSIHH